MAPCIPIINLTLKLNIVLFKINSRRNIMSYNYFLFFVDFIIYNKIFIFFVIWIKNFICLQRLNLFNAYYTILILFAKFT